LLCREGGDYSQAQNAVVETFFKTIKAELIWRRPWETRRQTETALASVLETVAHNGALHTINAFYDSRRRHSALGRKSPVAFERKAA